MNNKIKIGLSFVVGAAAGGIAVWAILKERCNQMMSDEINAFKEEYKQRMDEKKAATEKLEQTSEALKKAAEEAQKAADIQESFNILTKEGYIDKDEEGEPDLDEIRKKPYTIPPDMLGDEQYSICVLTYYADGVLTNDYDEVIEDIEGTVGKDSLKRFGEFEEDAIYVRNDELEIDYEINKDVRRYVDIGPDDFEYDE